MSKIVLFTGGARSGKSTRAEQYVTRLKASVVYVATAQVARAADEVYLVVCGIPVELKALEATWARE